MSLSPAKRDLLQRMLREKGLTADTTNDRLVPRAPDVRPIPLYPNQEGLWFVEQMHPGIATHNVPGTVRLVGRLDVNALESTLNEIVRRHETLRTSYDVGDDGTPEQRVHAFRATQLPVDDLTTLDPSEREPRARAIAREEAATPFDLSRGSLMRARLLTLGDEEHALLVNFHHSATDGWAMGVFSREFAALYTDFARGDTPRLAPLDVQFADFCLWHAARVRQGHLDAHLDFWRDMLGAQPPELVLPADRPRAATQSYRGAHEALDLSQAATQRLRSLAKSRNASLYHALQATFALVLYRHQRQTDFCIGSTFANRGEPASEKMMAFFANTLPIRYDLSGNPSLAEVVTRIRDVNLKVHEHHEVPFATLVKTLKPERSLGQSPYYDVVFDYLTPDHNPAVYGYGLSSTVSETLELPGLTVHPMDVEGGIARYDIAIFLWDMPEGLRGTVEYATDRFDGSTIRAMCACFQRAARLAVERPNDPIDALADALNAVEGSEAATARTTRKQSMRDKLKRAKRRGTS